MAIRIKAMYLLWREWLYSFGSMILCVVLAFIIPKTILPAIILALSWALNSYLTPMRANKMLVCVRVTSITSRVLFVSALIMVLCLMVNYTELFHWIFAPELLNREIPYISALIIFPVAAVFMCIGWLFHGRTRHCRDCKMMHGLTPEDSFASNYVHTEAIRQLKMLFWISLAVSIICWSYYFVVYSNASLNGADKYVFAIVPTVIFLVSLFYTGSRYKSIICTLKDIQLHHSDSVSTMRFLILHDETLLLETVSPVCPSDFSRADTPAVISLPFSQNYSEQFAAEKFKEISGLTDDEFVLRPLYCNLTADGHSNIYHYAVVINGDKSIPSTFKFSGLWSTLDVIDRLWKYNAITNALAAELNRVYTITMTWKTYDERGYRRYDIRNYRPTFRLRDFLKWDVDYNDTNWITVASNNQDQRLFRLRRLLRKISRKV